MSKLRQLANPDKLTKLISAVVYKGADPHSLAKSQRVSLLYKSYMSSVASTNANKSALSEAKRDFDAMNRLQADDSAIHSLFQKYESRVAEKHIADKPSTDAKKNQSEDLSFGSPQNVGGKIRTLKDGGRADDKVNRDLDESLSGMPNTVDTAGDTRTGVIFGDAHRESTKNRQDRDRLVKETELKSNQTQTERESRTHISGDNNRKTLTMKPDSKGDNPIKPGIEKPNSGKDSSPNDQKRKNEGGADNKGDKIPRQRAPKDAEGVVMSNGKHAKDTDKADTKKDKEQGRQSREEDNALKSDKKRDHIDHNKTTGEKDRKLDNNDKSKHNQSNKNLFMAQRREDDKSDMAYDKNKMKTDNEKAKERLSKNDADKNSDKDRADKNSDKDKADRDGKKDKADRDSKKDFGEQRTNQSESPYADAKSKPNKDSEGKNKKLAGGNNNSSKRDNNKLHKDVDNDKLNGGSVTEKAKEFYEEAKDKVKDALNTDNSSTTNKKDWIADESSEPNLPRFSSVDETPLGNSSKDKSHTNENIKDADEKAKPSIYDAEDIKKKTNAVNKGQVRMDDPKKSKNPLDANEKIFEDANKNDLKNGNMSKKHAENVTKKGQKDDPDNHPYQKYDINNRSVQEMVENDKDDLHEVGNTGDTGFDKTPNRVEEWGVTAAGDSPTARKYADGARKEDQTIGERVSSKIRDIMQDKK